ncbi:MAG: NRDE family protein [Pseudomonadota bacterium]
MCLLVFSYRLDTGFPLVVAANRDEFHARPTAPASFWLDAPQLLAGKDLQMGGTWMGMTRQGRFAAITNTRDPDQSQPAPRSRGELPLDYLIGSQTPSAFLNSLRARADQYAGFNLLVGNIDELWYFTNSNPVHKDLPRCLPPGLYGLSNASLDTPWPKVLIGKKRLTAIMESGEMSHETLAEVVADRHLAEPSDLKSLGLTGKMEHTLSSQFIVTPPYGTRSTTTMWMTASGEAHWRENSYNSEGQETGQRPHQFDVDANG